MWVLPTLVLWFLSRNCKWFLSLEQIRAVGAESTEKLLKKSLNALGFFKKQPENILSFQFRVSNGFLSY